MAGLAILSKDAVRVRNAFGLECAMIAPKPGNARDRGSHGKNPRKPGS
jgi:hypothetical protein